VLPDPGVLWAGSRGFAALAERCRALAAELRHGGQALCQGPGGWVGVAAEAATRRVGHLAAAVELAAVASLDAAAVLVVLAAALQDAALATQEAERLAAAAGWELTPAGPPTTAVAAVDAVAAAGWELAPAVVPVTAAAAVDPVTASRVAGLSRGAAERGAAALSEAGAGFAEIAERARAACALVERQGQWATAVDRRLHGPVRFWADVRQGLADGMRELAAGTVQAAALGSPYYWMLRPRPAWEQSRRELTGGLAALRHPGPTAAAALGTEDLGNGHAARFWARLVPQAILTGAAKGATLAREAALPRAVAAAGEAAAGEAARFSLAEVNHAYPGPGRVTNCALATDATLAGRPACALPGGATSIRVLEAHYGRSFKYASSSERIAGILERAGPGARGIVFASRGTRRAGHLFNAVNLDGSVRFVDGQSGGPAAVDGEGYVAFFLLRTD
jgi:Papain fold toxin 1, glutamine deamidase